LNTPEESETERDFSNPGSERVSGWEHLGRVVLVDQSLLGKTPRSNPAVYIGAFDHIRELFAQSEAARRRGLKASAFSFNSSQGQCELCRGAGFEKIEMQFLSDIYIRCSACRGRRYRQHILEVTLPSSGVSLQRVTPSSPRRKGQRALAPLGSSPSNGWSIADLLDATIDDGIQFLASFSSLKPAAQAVTKLRLLQEVGLGYLRLGQPINTLSGGESQRLKLVSHLADFAAAEARRGEATLFLFDEPTTGLHAADVAVLVEVFQRLVDRGHSLVVVEHNLDLIRCADWIVDLGPGAGDEGGNLVAEGTPEDIVRCAMSYTGQALRESGPRGLLMNGK
jgi:excinuclease ABC subunit A